MTVYPILLTAGVLVLGMLDIAFDCLLSKDVQ